MASDAEYNSIHTGLWESSAFRQACNDYAFLINRDYPERGVLKLTGDRYRLTRDQRTILYRGICNVRVAEARKRLLVNETTGKSLTIDGYNVLFSLLNYRLGRATFIATDNLLRDAGSLHGRLRSEEPFSVCVAMLLDYLQETGPSRADMYLDAPVSHSERHAAAIRLMMQERGLEGSCTVIRSADYALRNSHDTVLATSDTGIIDRAGLPVTDLPRQILALRYGAEPFRLSELLLSP
jgi:hypothetical protein